MNDESKDKAPDGEELVLYRVENGVAVISFNRPRQHNAFNGAMRAAHRAALENALSDPAVRAIVMRGEGPSFSSGMDLKELGKRAEGVSDYAHVSASLERKRAVIESPKPVIAAVRGYAMGAGCEAALHADIRVAGESARFGLTEINHGLITDGGGTCITAAIAGPSRAKYMVMTGELVDAQQALDWGLIDFMVPDEEVDARALQIAGRIAAQPPMHMSVAKQLCDGVHGQQIRQGMNNELLAISMLYKTDDRQEARASRKEGRKPTFTGL